MADTTVAMDVETAESAGTSRVYEAGYHISPVVKEEDIEKVVTGIRGVVEQAGGSFIAEGAPVLMRLSFPMYSREGEKYVEHDRGYFGWLKFESSVEGADSLRESLKTNSAILRSMVFRTVREETRAKMKAPQLREVKRTDTLKAAPRHVEEAAAPLSEVDLEKALENITVE